MEHKSKCKCEFKYKGNAYSYVIEVNSENINGVSISKEGAIAFSMDLSQIPKDEREQLSNVSVFPIFENIDLNTDENLI